MKKFFALLSTHRFVSLRKGMQGALFLFFTALITFSLLSAVAAQDLDVPYVPTPQPVVEHMLEVAGVGPGEYVIDLGSGDGRIVVAAAKMGAVAHGVDLDPDKVRQGTENARKAEVSDRALFIEEDIFETSISQASVITMYLLSSVNVKLRPRLLDELRPGSRVVSHSFDMDEWEADVTYDVKDESGQSHTVHLWIIPAKAGGTWSWEVDGVSFEGKIDQRFQEVDINVSAGGDYLRTVTTKLDGRRISFSVATDAASYLYSGRIEGDSIKGYVQVRAGEGGKIYTWSASRN
ncbi:MAG: class I SAM-dependent methyltransferase [Balneolaceae bacterium]|nr:class I SAM-dependent methyltransferase [Balneolaceae bacterium]